ncbi:MAG: rhomboid family intramembrane serine protease [Treponema sp.]|jgi:membrane associated rhomboid family serine protease|nr:rhomboid family intramembrane serine protease [Treponema sp.]
MNPLRRPFRYSYNGAVLWLIGINILVFFAEQVFGQRWILNRFAMIPAAVRINHSFWTFLTYMFLHDGFSHIFFNMFALFIFGSQVERQMGSKEFLLFYLVTGILAGVFSFAVYYLTGSYFIVLLGASGAVFAVLLAYAVFFPNAVIYIWGILPLRAPVLVLGFTALELFFSITGPDGRIAHLTHLAGFGFAWLYFLFRLGINPLRSWRR